MILLTRTLLEPTACWKEVRVTTSNVTRKKMNENSGLYFKNWWVRNISTKLRKLALHKQFEHAFQRNFLKIKIKIYFYLCPNVGWCGWVMDADFVVRLRFFSNQPVLDPKSNYLNFSQCFKGRLFVVSGCIHIFLLLIAECVLYREFRSPMLSVFGSSGTSPIFMSRNWGLSFSPFLT